MASKMSFTLVPTAIIKLGCTDVVELVMINMRLIDLVLYAYLDNYGQHFDHDITFDGHVLILLAYIVCFDV